VLLQVEERESCEMVDGCNDITAVPVQGRESEVSEHTLNTVFAPLEIAAKQDFRVSKPRPFPAGHIKPLQQFGTIVKTYPAHEHDLRVDQGLPVVRILRKRAGNSCSNAGSPALISPNAAPLPAGE